MPNGNYYLSAIDKIVEPLIIPLNDNSKKLLDRIKQAKKANKIEQPVGIIDNRPDSELTIEELAARELLRGKLIFFIVTWVLILVIF